MCVGNVCLSWPEQHMGEMRVEGGWGPGVGGRGGGRAGRETMRAAGTLSLKET